MKQKPRVPEESTKRPGQTGANRSLVPNDGSERRPMRPCEPSSVRTSGRSTEWAREPRLPKPKYLSVNSVDRRGGCAGDVSSLTRGGPSGWTSDNSDRVVRSEAARWIDALRGVRRAHSSRKASCRRRPWRHGQRIKQDASTGTGGDAAPRRRRRGEHRDVSVSMPGHSGRGHEKAQPATTRTGRTPASQCPAWPSTPGCKPKGQAAWTN